MSHLHSRVLNLHECAHAGGPVAVMYEYVHLPPRAHLRDYAPWAHVDLTVRLRGDFYDDNYSTVHGRPRRREARWGT